MNPRTATRTFVAALLVLASGALAPRASAQNFYQALDLEAFERESPVYALEGSPTEPLFAMGARDGSVILRHAIMGTERTIAAHENLALALGFSPDGETLVTAGADGTLKGWNVADGTMTMESRTSQVVRSLDFLPDGSGLVVGMQDGTIALINATNGTQFGELGKHDAAVVDVSVNPATGAIVTGDRDGTIFVFDGESQRRIVRDRNAHKGTIRSLAHMPDGSLMASAGQDGLVKFWRVEGERMTMTGEYEASSSFITDIAFDHDGSHLAITDYVSGLKVIVTATRASRFTHGTGTEVSRVAYANDGSFLAYTTTGTEAGLWRLRGANLTMATPMISAGDTLSTTATELPIGGTVTGRVLELKVDGNPVEPGAGGAFAETVVVPYGEKTITIELTDLERKAQTFTFYTRREDTTPPTLTISSPNLSELPIKVRSRDILIAGKVTDDFQTGPVKIGGFGVQPDAMGNFSHRMDLRRGINRIEIVALDAQGNETKQAFEVTRDAGRERVTGAAITLFEPRVENGDTVEVRQANYVLRGMVRPDDGIFKFQINNQDISHLEHGTFETVMPLYMGSNRVNIETVDSLQRLQTFTAVLQRVDGDPPIIAVTEPAGMRGMRNIRKASSRMWVRGTAQDASTVTSVLVAGRTATLFADGNFEVEIDLNQGVNNISIVATDAFGNESSEMLRVDRDASSAASTGGSTEVSVGKYYALVIGIDEYSGNWAPLNNAVRDAQAVAELLGSEYRFEEVLTLYNEDATRTNIIQKLEYLEANVTEDDNVMIYYSGHGDFKENRGEGYWVPVDATTSSTSSYVSNAAVQGFIGGIQSKHTLLVADACFAGDVFRGNTEMIEFQDSERYYAQVQRLKSRKAMTSGGVEPVMDGGRDGHSVFAYYLLRALRNNQGRFFDANQLFAEIRIPVVNNSAQTPAFDAIHDTGDEGGQFIFMRR